MSMFAKTVLLSLMLLNVIPQVLTAIGMYLICCYVLVLYIWNKSGCFINPLLGTTVWILEQYS